MTYRASLLPVLAAAIAAVQCSGPVNLTGPSATTASNTEVRALDAISADGAAASLRPLKKAATGLAGDWKGDLTLLEQDGDVFRNKVQLTLAEIEPGRFQGTTDGATLTLIERSTAGQFDATLTTGETRSCDGSAVAYGGSAAASDKRLLVNLQGSNDSCRLEIIELDLKAK
jgi:hypothetical protein